MSWNASYAFLLLAVTTVTWLGGRWIQAQRRVSDKQRWIIFLGALAVCLGILFFFKYFSFALYNINKIFALFTWGKIDNPLGSILLPMGISFFTFQAISYLIDVWRGKLIPERSFISYALYISFFPQLVAGPIERAGDFIPQIDIKKTFELNRIMNGLYLMLFGFFQKTVIADRAAIFVNAVFDRPVIYIDGGVINIFACGLFAIQIYCDFCGYSNIAIGAAQILGFKLTKNFNRPYFAKSPVDFWRRWHISLTRWFGDYLYIPLGGNRKGVFRRYLNILIVFCVSGLWHGAGWTYIVWGAINGFYQVVEILLHPTWVKIRRKFGDPETFGFRLGQVITTFILISLALVYFRSASLQTATAFIHGMGFINLNDLFSGALFNFGLDSANFVLLISSIFVLLLTSWQQRYGSLRDQIASQPFWLRCLLPLGLFAVILLFGVYGSQFQTTQFIYFQF